ncbi:aspartoacylase [Opacimonas viscosa]|uniref:Aspartoacylase n=1 Tax=Opacimonas viscosa TaxID=2961944 RepID=A0AA41X0A5_9ALTE|nr:aspartoacylase [Opacimonas viscosa]MCP3427981.1 aspartoacylase [Opacimonas viscosa]
MPEVQSIAIVGGTHGNELTGIQLVRHLQNFPITYYDDIVLSFILANAEAIAANVRFIDVDLNRQFHLDNLKSSNSMLYELNLAKILNQKIGPKQAPLTDLVIDIHNTTSAMGPTLIVLEDSDFYREMARYLKQHMPEANILLEDEVPYQEHPYLCTVGKRGIMLEIGAQPQGVSRADIFAQCQNMLQIILAYVDLYNKQAIPTSQPVDTYRFGEVVLFPMDEEDQIIGLVHPNLLDGDFKPVAVGEPIFAMFDGSELLLQGDKTIYPHFVNEAAYKQSNVAFSTADKFEW